MFKDANTACGKLSYTPFEDPDSTITMSDEEFYKESMHESEPMWALIRVNYLLKLFVYN